MNYKIKNLNLKKKKNYHIYSLDARCIEDVDWDDLLELAQVERGMSKAMGPDGQTHR